MSSTVSKLRLFVKHVKKSELVIVVGDGDEKLLKYKVRNQDANVTTRLATQIAYCTLHHLGVETALESCRS